MNKPETWCCKLPDIMNSDHPNGFGEPNTINRVCLNCYSHWYGAEDSAKRYTRIEWNEYLDSKVKEF